MGTKACVTAAEVLLRMATYIASCVLWTVDITISVVSQSRILVPQPIVQYMETHLFAFLFIWQLATAGLQSDLDTDDGQTPTEYWTDTNWTCWLTADARVRTTQAQIWNSLRQLQQCSIIHLLQRVHRWLLLLMRLPWQNSCSHSSHLMTTPWDTLAKSLPRNCPIRTALQFQCRYQRLYF